jgi:hypothetical protein
MQANNPFLRSNACQIDPTSPESGYQDITCPEKLRFILPQDKSDENY